MIHNQIRHWVRFVMVAFALLPLGLGTGAMSAQPLGATVEIVLRSCPDGVEPFSNPGACTNPVKFNTDVWVQNATGFSKQVPLQRDPTRLSYTITGLPEGTYIFLPPLVSSDWLYQTAASYELDVNDDYSGFTIQNGQSGVFWVYYSNTPGPGQQDTGGMMIGDAPASSDPQTPATAPTPTATLMPTSVPTSVPTPDPTAAPTQTPHGTSSAEITLFSCGRDWRLGYSDLSECSRVVQGDGTEYLTNLATGTSHKLVDFPQDRNGAYLITGLDADSRYTLTGFDPITRDAVYSNLIMDQNGDFILDTGAPGHTSIVQFYYYYQTDSQTTRVNPTVTASITLYSCPEGWNPQLDSHETCDIVDGDGIEYLVERGTNRTLRLTDFPQTSAGAYEVSGLTPNATYDLVGFEPVSRDAYSFQGLEWDSSSRMMYLETGSGGIQHAAVIYYFRP